MVEAETDPSQKSKPPAPGPAAHTKPRAAQAWQLGVADCRFGQLDLVAVESLTRRYSSVLWRGDGLVKAFRKSCGGSKSAESAPEISSSLFSSEAHMIRSLRPSHSQYPTVQGSLGLWFDLTCCFFRVFCCFFVCLSLSLALSLSLETSRCYIFHACRMHSWAQALHWIA